MSSSFDGYSTLGPKKGRLKSPRNHRSKRAMSIANGDLNYQMNRMILRAKARNISTDGLCPIGYNVRKWMIDAAVLPLRIRRSERGRERKGARDKKDVCMHQYVYCVYIYIYILYIIYTWERERERERATLFRRKHLFDRIMIIFHVLPKILISNEHGTCNETLLRHPMVAPGSTCPYRVVLGTLPTPSSMTRRAANDRVSAPGGRSAGASKDWWAVPRRGCR